MRVSTRLWMRRDHRRCLLLKFLAVLAAPVVTWLVLGLRSSYLLAWMTRPAGDDTEDNSSRTKMT